MAVNLHWIIIEKLKKNKTECFNCGGKGEYQQSNSEGGIDEKFMFDFDITRKCPCQIAIDSVNEVKPDLIGDLTIKNVMDLPKPVFKIEIPQVEEVEKVPQNEVLKNQILKTKFSNFNDFIKHWKPMFD